MKESIAFEIAKDRNLQDEDLKMLKYAQLGLRLLGVMLFIEGIIGILGCIAYWVADYNKYQYLQTDYVYDSYIIYATALSVFSTLAGYLLMSSCNWLLIRVFIPAEKETSHTKDTLSN